MPLDALDDLAAGIVRTISQPLLVLDRTLTVLHCNPAFLECFGVERAETEGRFLYDLGNRQWDIAELRRLLDRILTTEESVRNYRVKHEFETIGLRIMLLNATRIRRGEVEDLILLAIADITQQEDEHRQLVAAKEFAEKTVDAVRDPLLILNWDLYVKSANQAFYDAFKVTPPETVGRLVYDLGNGQWNIPELRKLLEHVLPENNAFNDYIVDHDFKDIGRRVMLLNGRRLDHEPLILLAIEDITERGIFERRHVLVGELQHRMKNILTNVRTIARQSYIGADNREDFMKLLDGRLDALARTQDLAARSPDSVVALDELIQLELSAVHMLDRAHIQGCNIHIRPGIAQLMAMTVHELTTNAIKYGALNVDEGRIDIESKIEFQSGEKFMRFRWREHGVRIDTDVKRRGFGFQIIEESLPYLLGGSSKLEFHPDGIECTMSVPLPNGRS